MAGEGRLPTTFFSATPETVIDSRPGGIAVIQTADADVRNNRLTGTTGYDGGLDIARFTGVT
jgi:hypothetical protein